MSQATAVATTDIYSARRVRNGKTRRDHQDGAWRRRFENLEARAGWIHTTRASNSNPPPMIKAHGLGNSSKRFKIKAAKRAA
jgi:hypothetical protein